LKVESKRSILKSKSNNYLSLERRGKFFLLLISFILFFGTFLSCKNKKHVKFTAVKEYVFKTDFTYNRSKVIYSKELKKEIIYFADITTKKKISFFNFNGLKLYETPLNHIYNCGQEIGSFEVLNKDSIVVLSLYSDIVFLLNKNGVCKKTIYLDSLICDVHKNSNEYYNINYIGNNRFLFAASWLGSDTIKIPQNTFQYYEYFFRNLTIRPKLVSLDIFNPDKTNFNWGFDSAYFKISKDNKLNLFFENDKYEITDKNIFFYSWYSNKIYKLNRGTQKLEKEIIIQQAGEEIGVKPKHISKENQNYIFDSINIGLQTEASIIKVVFDKYRNLFYVIIAHKHDIKFKGKDRLYTIIVYDKDFEKIDEITLDKEKYSSSILYVCKQGILILTKSKKIEDHDKPKFQLFKVDY